MDVTGLTYDQPGAQLPAGRPGASRRGDEAWQRYLRHYLAGPGALRLVQAGNDGLGPIARRPLARDRKVLDLGRLSSYIR